MKFQEINIENRDSSARHRAEVDMSKSMFKYF